jgi:hypothetical protein
MMGKGGVKERRTKVQREVGGEIRGRREAKISGRRLTQRWR